MSQKWNPPRFDIAAGQDTDRIARDLTELDALLKEWTSTPMGRRAFIASLPLLFGACATSKHRYREGNNVQSATSLTVQDEEQMTREALPQMQKDYPRLESAEAQSFLTSLGQRIVRANGLDGHPYRYNFTVVATPMVNAFALPAGTVFVTAPLLAMAESEAELAGVVGHEIGHIKARHTAQRMDRAKGETGRSVLFGLGGGLLGGAAGFGLGKVLCGKEDNKCLVQATGIGAAVGAGGGLLIQKYAFMANSQEDEMEADRIGFKTSVAAGYSKDHVGLFYEKLLRMEETHKKNNVPIVSSIADAMSTHPPSRERVAQMQELVRETQSPPGRTVNSPDFSKIKAMAVEWTKANSQKPS